MRLDPTFTVLDYNAGKHPREPLVPHLCGQHIGHKMVYHYTDRDSAFIILKMGLFWGGLKSGKSHLETFTSWRQNVLL